MPLLGLPSLRAARVAEVEKLLVCEALENAGTRNPGGRVADRCAVAEMRPPNMLRLEQCIVFGGIGQTMLLRRAEPPSREMDVKRSRTSAPQSSGLAERRLRDVCDGE